MSSQAHKQYFKNYDYALLTLEADQRGFIVGQSRVGVSKLRSAAGSWTSIKGGFISISTNLPTRTVDGAWIEPEVSSLTLVSRDAALFQSLDGYELRQRYNGSTIFSGVITESVLASDIGDDNTEEFTVTLTARGFEAIKNGLPAVGTIQTLWSVSGGGGPVVQWAAGKARARAADMTGRTVAAEDDQADAQIEETLAVENDLTGTQGELLADLAIRTGTLLDQSSGVGVTFRSYQGIPVWRLEDKHLVSGYNLAVDRESATALAATRKEDEAYVVSFRAGTARVLVQRTISLPFNDPFRPGNFGAYTPLQATPKTYLSDATIPRHDDLAIPSRLPIRAHFRHGGTTYRAAVVGLLHTITPERWMMTIQGAPVHLVTRVSDLAPTPPQHVKGSVGGTTATITWSTEQAGTNQGTPLTPNYFILTTAEAAGVDVGDELRLYSSAGALKEDTIFIVTAKSAPSGGFVNVSVSPNITASVVAGDLLRFNDYGVAPDGGWQVWYQQVAGDDNRQIAPFVTGFVPAGVAAYTNSAAIPGLGSGLTYRFTVFAISSTPNVHSAPSKYIQLVVP